MNIETISALVFFGCLGLPFVILGTAILVYPRKAIDNSLKMAKRLPTFDSDDTPANPYSTRYIFYYRLIGLSFILIMLIPVIAILVTS